MIVKRIDVKKINPAPYNPRVDLQPGDVDYEKLKRSIETFGCVEPLIWNKQTGNLVGGHQRFKILLARGDTTVQVSEVDLAIAQEQALNIALNKISGDWDEDRLAELLKGLVAIPDFDVSLTGFDNVEFPALLDRVNEESDDNFDLGDDLEAHAEAPAITQPGEIIQLGEHRILCGDSSKAEDVHRLFGNLKADLINGDPPYNVDYYGGKRPTPDRARPKQSRQWKRIYSDNLPQVDYEKLLERDLSNILTVMAPGAPFYLWNGHRQFGPMHALLTEANAHISCVIVWAKENFAISYADYSQQTEFCLYGWKRDTKAAKDGSTAHRWYGPTNETTLWDIRRDATRSYRHPTQKPVALAERALRNSSQRGDLVFDPFLGSGSTLIGAQRLGRRCFGIEIDPRYCDGIVRRYLQTLEPSNRPADLVAKYGGAPESLPSASALPLLSNQAEAAL